MASATVAFDPEKLNGVISLEYAKLNPVFRGRQLCGCRRSAAERPAQLTKLVNKPSAQPRMRE